MKKIILSFILCLISMMVACSETDIKVEFEHVEVFEYTIGDPIPHFQSAVEVFYGETSLAGLLVIDDSEVNYEQVGSYLVTFKVTYQGQLYQSDAIVEVNEAAFNGVVDFNFFYLNDLHGAILENGDSMGLAKIGNLILDEQANHPDSTIFLAGGDMLQGQILSNWYDGASIIDLFNDLSMDAFVLGNHEFDWGIEVVLSYFNGQNTLQANFPVLGANIFKKSDDTLLESVEPYTIIEKSGVKIGVIGTMGYGLESSIIFNRIDPYYFADPVSHTESWASYLREEENVDIVVAVTHGNSSFFNNALVQMSGSSRIDAIFNGHSHTTYTYHENNQNRVVPIIQTGSSGENVGKVTLSYDLEAKKIVESKAINLNSGNESRLQTSHQDLAEKISLYVDEISNLYEPIMVAGASYSQSELAYYIAELMQKYTNADVGMHNFGGTRTDIVKDEQLSYAKLFEISPFDNTVVLVELKGSALLNLSGAMYYKDGFSQFDIDPNETYTLATNDYIFSNTDTLKNAPDYTFTGISVLDVMVQVIENQKDAGYELWYTSLDIIFNQDLTFQMEAIIPEKFVWTF